MNDASRAKRPRVRRTAAAKSGEQHANVANMAQAEAASRAASRRSMVAEAAYYRAERRGFLPGHELEDWFAAEIEIGNSMQLDVVAPGEETALRRVS